MRSWMTFVVPMLLSLSSAPLAAADGDLDPGFWSDGRVVLTGTGDYEVNAVLAAPDGRVVVAGTHDPGDGILEWFWWTVADSGSPAPSVCYFDPPGAATQGRAEAAVFDSSGRLLLAGSALYDFNRLAMARFSYPDCVLDDGFNADGYWNVDLPGGIEALTAIAVHPPNGRIAVGGYQKDLFSSEYDMVVAVISDSGSLYSGFSGDGWLTLDFADAGYDDFVARVAFDHAGGLFAAGTTDYTGDGADADWAIAKFDSSGALDPSFDGNGIRALAFDLGAPDYRLDELFGLAFDPGSGNLVLAGKAQSTVGSSLAIARLLPSGALDPTFSGDGKVDLAFGDASSPACEVAVDGLGRILVAGYFKYPGNDADFFAMRYSATGELDPTFGFGGLSLIPFDAGPDDHDDDYGWAMAMQGGRVVVAGGVEVNAAGDNRVGLARLDVALIFADGFGSGGVSLWSSSTGAL